MQDVSDYCRRLETYLCQKNAGHLIRIVGPAFEQVCGWAERGVPLKIAYRGIDRYCERYYAKGPRRRPVRIEFCEADILESFDDWRRAVGVAPSARERGSSRRATLAAHIERVVARLLTAGSRDDRSTAFGLSVRTALGELDLLGATAHRARGAERAAIVARLAALDAELIEAAVGELDEGTTAVLRKEAEVELAPFGSRMVPAARSRAIDAAYHRLVRESLGLPTVAYE